MFMLTGKNVVSSLSNIGFTVNRYSGDETLILYRTSRKYVVDLLQPSNTSQALHVSAKNTLTGNICHASWLDLSLELPV